MNNYKFIMEVISYKCRYRCFKRKKTICILKPYGEIIKKPFEVEHTENQFRISYSAWAKKKGYYQSHTKAIEIYRLAQKSIPVL